MHRFRVEGLAKTTTVTKIPAPTPFILLTVALFATFRQGLFPEGHPHGCKLRFAHVSTNLAHSPVRKGYVCNMSATRYVCMYTFVHVCTYVGMCIVRIACVTMQVGR